MNWAGVETIQAEELSVIPGLDEIFALIDVKTHVEGGKYDLLIVDCAPTAETLRLLLAARGHELVHRADLPGRAARREDAAPDRVEDDDAADRGRRGVSRRSSGCTSNLDAVHEILTDESVVDGAARREPGEDGDRRGAAHVHVPRAVRLPRATRSS